MKVSAHDSVKEGLVGAFEVEIVLKVDAFSPRDWQHLLSASFAPQQPDGPVLVDCEAANVLQKSVLRGSVRHWAHVPGSLEQGLVVWLMGGRIISERTSPSDGGGVNCERFCMGASLLFSKDS